MQVNELSGAEAMVRMLEAYGVKHMFGLCGDTTLPFYDALARLDHGITHLLTRDERHAAYMADAYARVTGRVGVCEGPSGGGATYILPGVVEANESSVPVLAITTDVSTASRGRFPLTELDQKSLFRPLTKWNTVIDRADRLPAELRAAFRAMTTGRPGAAHIGLPYDVQINAVPESEIWAEPDHQTFPAWRSGPDPAQAEKAAQVLLAARKLVIICGGGVVSSGAEPELLSLAEALDAPVATTVSGQGAIAETHRLSLGVVGANGGVEETRAVVAEADTVLFIACRAGSITTEKWRFPAPGTRIVHIDADAMVPGANYQTAAALIGDARLALAALNTLIGVNIATAHPGNAGKARAAKAVSAKFAAFDALAASRETPIRPERVVQALNRLLPDDAIVTADPGTPCPYFSAYFRLRKAARHFITNRAHGALGYAAAAAIGAHYGRPGAKIVAAMGDGSFGFTVGEFETVTRCNMPITFIVFSNSAYGWIKAGQRTSFGKRFYNVDFSRTDHAAIAAAYGIKSWRVEDPEALEGVLRQALEHPGPALVDIISQPLDEARAPVSEWIV